MSVEINVGRPTAIAGKPGSYKKRLSPKDVHDQTSAARRHDALVGPKAATAPLLITDAH